MTGDSEEEILVRKFLEQGGADVIVAVLDATKLERNLYLFTQVTEFSPKLIAVVNMIDEAERQGLIIDVGELSSLLGVPVLLTAASEGREIDRILPLALGSARVATLQVPYDHHIEAALNSLEKTLGVPCTRACWPCRVPEMTGYCSMPQELSLTRSNCATGCQSVRSLQRTAIICPERLQLQQSGRAIGKKPMIWTVSSPG